MKARAVSAFPSLVEIADRVDELVSHPANMTAWRRLALPCIATRPRSHIDNLQLPRDPKNGALVPGDFDEEVILDVSQAALILALLHDAKCRGAKKIIPIKNGKFGDHFDEEGRRKGSWGRFVRWKLLKDNIEKLGEYAAPWFMPLLRLVEGKLPVRVVAGGKTRTPKEELNMRVRDWLAQHGKKDPNAITIRQVADALRAAQSSIANTPAWQAFESKRKKLRTPKPRESQMTDEMLAMVAAPADPAHGRAKLSRSRLRQHPQQRS